MAVVPEASYVVAVLVLVAPVLAGPGATASELGDGTAALTVVSPGDDALEIEQGRFGTSVAYLRLPDLVVDVGQLSGRPRVVYGIRVPELGVDRRATKLIRGAGRLRLHLSDRAYPPDGSGLPDPGTYRGQLTVRVQSFSSDRTVLNRTVTVEVPG